MGEDVAREGILQAARLNALMAMINSKKFLGCWERIMGRGDKGCTDGDKANLLCLELVARLRKQDFEALGQCAPGEQDTPPAGQTFQTNIGTQADDLPFITSARVRFA